MGQGADEGTVDNRAGELVLRLRLLDDFAADYAGRPVGLSGMKTRALVAVLAVSETGAVTREFARGLLWSNSTEERAQASLRDLIRKMNGDFGGISFDGFAAARETVSIDKSQMHTDVDDILNSCLIGQPSETLCYQPDILDRFLYGFEDLDEALNDWIRAKREALTGQCLKRLEAWLGQPGITAENTRNIAKILLFHDPYNERACQALISALDRMGDKSGALAVYQTFWEKLDEQFGEEPSQQTQALIVDIKSRAQNRLPALFKGDEGVAFDPADDASDRVPLALQRAKPVILVSILDLAHVASDRRHVVRGLKQDLIACLVRFREWHVLDTDDVDLGTINMATAQANYKLVISATATDQMCRVAILFSDMHSGEGIWSQRFELEADNWVTMQNSVVRRMAVALNLHLSFDRLARVRNWNDDQITAYDSWLKGQELIREFNQESWEAAEQLFEATLTNHPHFSRAYSSLAELENSRHIQFPGVMSSGRTRQRGLDFARMAVRLDPLDSRSQLCLGWASAMNRQFERAELAFILAYENNENDPWTLVSAAVGLAFCDQPEHSTELATLALSLDIAPSKLHWSFQAVISFLNGDYEKCAAACEKGDEVSVDLPAWHAAALARLGRLTEASDRREKFVELVKASWTRGQPATEQDVARWLLGCYPIRSPASLARFRAGLNAAGFRGGDLAHASSSLAVSGE